MKLFVLISLTLACTTTVQCQYQFGLFAGPQATTAHYAINGKKQSQSFKYGLQLGANWKIPFDNHLYFSPEIFYSLKGYKAIFSQQAYPPDATATDNNTLIHCFELAALLQVDFGNQPGHLFVQFGPSLDFQLSGNEKFHLLDGTYHSRNMPYGYSEYGRYAANGIVQFGFEDVTGFFVYAQYGYGLTNLCNADGGPSIRHRVAGISFGKYLSKKKL